MSFLTCFWLFPQNEHFSRSPPSPIRATGGHPPVRPAWCRWSGSAVLCRSVLSFARGHGWRILRRYLFRTSLTGPHTPTLPGTPPARGPTRRRRSGQRRGPDPRVEDRVDQAVLDRLLGGQDLVAL